MARIPASRRRDLLARAALRVIARDGLAAASTRAIVAEAGMPLASFHYAVPSRDALLRDVVDLVVAEERLAAEALLITADSPREALHRALTGYLDHVRADPGHEQAMFELTQYALRTTALADLPAQQYGAYRAVVAGLLAAAGDAFGIRWSIPHDELARLIVGITDGLTLAWLADRDDLAAARTIDASADALARFAVQGVDA